MGCTLWQWQEQEQEQEHEQEHEQEEWEREREQESRRVGGWRSGAETWAWSLLQLQLPRQVDAVVCYIFIEAFLPVGTVVCRWRAKITCCAACMPRDRHAWVAAAERTEEGCAWAFLCVE